MSNGANGSHRKPIGIVLSPPKFNVKQNPFLTDEPRFFATVDFLAKTFGITSINPKETNGFVMRGTDGKWYCLEEVVKKMVEWMIEHMEKGHEKP